MIFLSDCLPYFDYCIPGQNLTWFVTQASAQGYFHSIAEAVFYIGYEEGKQKHPLNNSF